LCDIRIVDLTRRCKPLIRSYNRILHSKDELLTCQLMLHQR